jgi:hypothetical protein
MKAEVVAVAGGRRAMSEKQPAADGKNADPGVQEMLADWAHFVLSAEQWEAFCRALDAPPRKIPALEQLFANKGVFDGPESVFPE